MVQIHDFSAEAEREAARQRRAEYLARNGLKPYRKSYANVLKVLKLGGAAAEDCRKVAEMLCGGLGRYGSLSSWHAFDHGELLGSDGKPSHLMGYPYQLDGEGLAQLAALESIGLWVLVHSRSNYGFGTLQVEAHAPNSGRHIRPLSVVTQEPRP